ncbi:MXAN_6640 family putative metalloprotease [Gemmatimonadota bacterium]
MGRSSTRFPQARILHLIGMVAGVLLIPRSGESQEVTRAEFQNLANLETEAFRAYLQPSERELPIKCGFPIIMNVVARLGRAAAVSQVIRPSLENEQTWQSPGEDFLLHYTINSPNSRWDEVPDEDADGDFIPDYLEAAAASLDSIRAGYIQLGWRLPISDGDQYDVYFTNLENLGWFGYTQPDQPVSTTPPYTAASFIVLENDYPETFYGHDPVTSMRVTIAHEYHHAVQFAYHLPLTSAELPKFAWFAEASATYHEEIFYDGINDYYGYLHSFLEFPDISLTTDGSAGNHMYGAVLWVLYLESLLGPDTNRSIWTMMAEGSTIPIEAHRLVLDEEETSLLEAYGEFTSWILHTGDRAIPGEHFEEGANYSQVRINVGDFEEDEVTLPALATLYRRRDRDDNAGTGGIALRVLPMGEAGPANQLEWGAGIAGLDGSALSSVRVSTNSSTIPGSGAGAELFDWQSYDSVIQWSFTGDNISLTTGLSLERTAGTGTAHSERLTLATGNQLILNQNFPNPFRAGTHDRTWFSFSIGSPGDVVLEVRSLSGRILWSKTLSFPAAGHYFTDELGFGWDGRDDAGREMPSGIYLLIAQLGHETRLLKFSLIR